jgi:hypothetical protein
VAYVLRLGMKVGDGFLAVVAPDALDVKAIWIVAAAAPAIGPDVEVLILKGNLSHSGFVGCRCGKT